MEYRKEIFPVTYFMGLSLTILSKILNRNRFSGFPCSNKGACMEYMSDLLLDSLKVDDSGFLLS